MRESATLQTVARRRKSPIASSPLEGAWRTADARTSSASGEGGRRRRGRGCDPIGPPRRVGRACGLGARRCCSDGSASQLAERAECGTRGHPQASRIPIELASATGSRRRSAREVDRICVRIREVDALQKSSGIAVMATRHVSSEEIAVAHHEAGHTIAALVNGVPVEYATIGPTRSPAPSVTSSMAVFAM